MSKDRPKPPSGRPSTSKMLPRRERLPRIQGLSNIKDEKQSTIRCPMVQSPEAKTRCPQLSREPGKPLVPIQHRVINKGLNTMTTLPRLDDITWSVRGSTASHSQRPSPPRSLAVNSHDIEKDVNIADPWEMLMKNKPVSPQGLPDINNGNNSMVGPRGIALQNRRPQPPSGPPTKRTVQRRLKRLP